MWHFFEPLLIKAKAFTKWLSSGWYEGNLKTVWPCSLSSESTWNRFSPSFLNFTLRTLWYDVRCPSRRLAGAGDQGRVYFWSTVNNLLNLCHRDSHKFLNWTWTFKENFWRILYCNQHDLIWALGLWKSGVSFQLQWTLFITISSEDTFLSS